MGRGWAPARGWTPCSRGLEQAGPHPGVRAGHCAPSSLALAGRQPRHQARLCHGSEKPRGTASRDRPAGLITRVATGRGAASTHSLGLLACHSREEGRSCREVLLAGASLKPKAPHSSHSLMGWASPSNQRTRGHRRPGQRRGGWRSGSPTGCLIPTRERKDDGGGKDQGRKEWPTPLPALWRGPLLADQL